MIIQLTDENGNKVWVNPEHISSFQRCDGYTIIQMRTNRYIIVMETPRQIMNRIYK